MMKIYEIYRLIFWSYEFYKKIYKINKYIKKHQEKQKSHIRKSKYTNTKKIQ